MLLLYSPLNSYLYVHWILDFKSILLLLLLLIHICVKILYSNNVVLCMYIGTIENQLWMLEVCGNLHYVKVHGVVCEE